MNEQGQSTQAHLGDGNHQARLPGGFAFGSIIPASQGKFQTVKSGSGSPDLSPAFSPDNIHAAHHPILEWMIANVEACLSAVDGTLLEAEIEFRPRCLGL